MDFDPVDRQLENRINDIRKRRIEIRAAAFNQFDDALVSLRRLRQNRHPPPGADALVCDITDKP